MKKKQTLWEFIKYYYIIPYLLAAIALVFANEFLFNLFINALEITERNPFYGILKVAFPIGLTSILIFFFFTSCRERRYFYLTGRHYGGDHGKYKRFYAELVDYFKDAEPHKLDTSTFDKTPWREASGILFGKQKDVLIRIPSRSECNIAVMGPPGSGKTAGIAIPNAMSFKGSTVVIDIKGDIYNYVSTNTDRKILRFCPDSPDALKDSIRFNPLDGIDKMSPTDKKLYIESMSIVLIAEQGGNDNYFVTRARKLFQGITYLILDKNPNASFPDIIHEILQGNVFNWVETAIASNCKEAKEYLASFYGNSEKNVAGAYDALTTALVHFSNPVLDELLSNKGKSFSIKYLDKGYDLYLQITQEHLDAYAPIFTLLLQNLSVAFTKRPDSSTGVKTRPILMVLDEFPALTYSYALINSNLATLRSKSVICMIIQQNLSQLEYKYQPAGARSLLGNCNYQIILGSNDINSSKVFSETFGTKKVLKVSNSVTMSNGETQGRSCQETTERVFPPEYFGDLSNDNKMIIYFKGKYCECSKINCYRD